MASIITDYEYDIFVSYRQKDNRSDHWVTNFVQALREELDATFKEEVSIYFDSNPHDGLLETHDVDGSLRGKIKCLIFIPIVSQTYCDPKSFAWQNEFLAFLDFAKEDQFGLDIKLSGGNVAKRVLPVRIHEIDEVDKKLFEDALGGVLRPVDFIFKSSGVNRPLRSNEDHPQDNQSKTFYRDQINKVANAIKEIISVLNPSAAKAQNSYNVLQPPKSIKTNIAIVFTITLLLVVAAYILFHILTLTKDRSITEKSIAVLPLSNLSNDAEQEYFSDGLSEELLTRLSHVKDLKVIGRTSSFAYKGKNEDLRTIGSNLGVNFLLQGSVRRSNEMIRITVQLISSADGSQIWTKSFEKEFKEIFSLQDEVALAVIDQLEARLITDQLVEKRMNPVVHDLFLKANYYLGKQDPENLNKALSFLLQAKAIDSLDAKVWAALASVYESQSSFGMIDLKQGSTLALEAAKNSIQLDYNLADGHRQLSFLMTRQYDWDGARQEAEIAYKLAPSNVAVILLRVELERVYGHMDEVVRLCKHAVELDPQNVVALQYAGFNLYLVNRFIESIQYGKKVNLLSPQMPYLHFYMSQCYVMTGNQKMAFTEIQNETIPEFKDLGTCLYWLQVGNKAEADKALSDFINKNRNAYLTATAFAVKGDIDKVFEWLDKAIAQNDQYLYIIKSNPYFKSIRNDPRYVKILKDLNLPVD